MLPGCIFLVLFIALSIKLLKERAWSKRPNHFCIACRTIMKPGRKSNLHYYCSACVADDPVVIANLFGLGHSLAAPSRSHRSR
jgi:hypothetical protein